MISILSCIFVFTLCIVARVLLRGGLRSDLKDPASEVGDVPEPAEKWVPTEGRRDFFYWNFSISESVIV